MDVPGVEKRRGGLKIEKRRVGRGRKEGDKRGGTRGGENGRGLIWKGSVEKV